MFTIAQLIEHLPHSVSGVGDELARGDPDLEPFYSVGKVRPSELLGFAVVVRHVASVLRVCVVSRAK